MSTSLLGAITFIGVFAGIILLHELGHYLVSVLMRIEVEEFGIFFPPRMLRIWRKRGSLLVGKQQVIIPHNTNLPFDITRAIPHVVDVTADEVKGKLVLRSLKFAASEDGQAVPAASNDQGEPVPEETLKDYGNEVGSVRLSGALNEINQGTEFTLNWIPLGGFNRIRGESDPDVPHGLAAAKPWKRILVYLGGAAMNLLTGVVVYMVLFSQMGVPDASSILISEVFAGSPAEAAGFQAGDLVRAVDGEWMQSTEEFISVINSHPDEELTITVQRDEKSQDLQVTPRLDEADGKGRIGIALSSTYRPVRSIWENFSVSLLATAGSTEQILALPGQLIAGTISPEEAQLSGPRTIWNLFQQAVQRDTQTRDGSATGGGSGGQSYYTLLLIISLTISVGVLNLLPIPALDGGRIFMSLIEVVIRRPIPAKYQMAINSIGFIVLLVVLGGFYIKDIISPIAVTLP